MREITVVPVLIDRGRFPYPPSSYFQNYLSTIEKLTAPKVELLLKERDNLIEKWHDYHDLAVGNIQLIKGDFENFYKTLHCFLPIIKEIQDKIDNWVALVNEFIDFRLKLAQLLEFALPPASSDLHQAIDNLPELLSKFNPNTLYQGTRLSSWGWHMDTLQKFQFAKEWNKLLPKIEEYAALHLLI